MIRRVWMAVLLASLFTSGSLQAKDYTDEFEQQLAEAAKTGQLLLRIRDPHSSWFVLIKLN